MTLYALNLFDLADNESYRHYSRRSAGAVGKHGGRVVALGRLDGVQVGEPDVEPRTVMILVEWQSHEAFRAFLDDPEHAYLHRLREEGTRQLPLVALRAPGGSETPLRGREPSGVAPATDGR